MNAKLFFCLFFIFSSLSAFAQDPYSDAIKAYQEKNYKAYLDNIVIVRSLLKAHTGIIEMTARAYALNNKSEDALRELNLIADMGGSANLDNPDYASIKDHKELQVISEKFAANNKPVVISSKAFTLPDKEFIPEGLAFNPNDNSFYVGSITKGVIRKILPDGSSKEVIKLKAPAALSVTGMKVDAENNVLWVCAFAGSAAGEKKGAAAIYKYNTKDHSMIDEFYSSEPNRSQLFNDVVFTKNRDVYFTESENGRVMFIPAGKMVPEEFIASGNMIYANGIALSDDEKFLFVADAAGISRISLQSKEVTKLAADQDVSIFGLDGMYFYKGSLIGVQNSFVPFRIIKINLSDDLSVVNGVEVLESNNPAFDIPTTGAIAGDTFYFIANSQLGNLNEKGQIADPAKLQEPVILKLPLK